MVREERRGAVAVVTLSYPERRNALGMPMRQELIEAFDDLEADASVRAVVVTGAGGHFSAGGDISGMNTPDVAAGRERFRVTHRLVRLLVESRLPIVAAIEGVAVGAGLSLALCCDTIVAAQSARFSASFGKIGLVADFGMLHTLPKRIGEGRAKQLMMYGELMAAPDAERIGLIDRLVPDGTALKVSMERAEALAATAPLPIAMTKSFLSNGLAEALEWERTVQTMLFFTPDHGEGKAAFLEKRPARFA